MMSYRENQKKIEGAFAAALSRMDSVIIAGMSSMLDAGMDYCMQHHDDVVEGGRRYHLEHHEQMKDSYGWALFHNGFEVMRKIHPAPGLSSKDGREVKGRASDALTAIRTEIPMTGWVGVVLASVVPVSYFKLKAEFKVMRLATKDLKNDDFANYFERI